MKPKKIDINNLELQDFKEIKELAKNKEMILYFYTELMAIQDPELQNGYIEDSLDKKPTLDTFFPVQAKIITTQNASYGI